MEGCDGDRMGRPGELTLRRYKRFAAGGAGLIWVEATAVVPEGRANPRQLWLHADSRDSFRSMVEMIHREAAESMGRKCRPVLILQLTHSGRYCKPHGTPQPLICARDPYRDAMVPQARPQANLRSRIADDQPLVSDECLDSLQQAYLEAARLAYEVGFDAVDIKACHGYLINELLGCRTREGKYGGSFTNRTRFLLDVIDRIHDDLGKEKQVTTRLGVYDAVPRPYGWGVDEDDWSRPDLAEPKRLVDLLRDRGISLINITAANPYYNPHINRPFAKPISNGYEEPEHPLVGVTRLIDLAGEIQKAYNDVAVVGTGYSWLETLMPNVAAAVKVNGLASIIGVGRMAFAYPDFAKDILRNGKLDNSKVCVTCSGCSQIMRDGGTTGCIVRDAEIYGPIYKQGIDRA
jgi:2,4-dienoyl-CoA reductase-like NADH-dependent reductase (Old Yellow Enzyme family)